MRVLCGFIIILSFFIESLGNLNNENKTLWTQPVNKSWESIDSIDVKKHYYGNRGFVNPPFFLIYCLDSLNWGYFAQDNSPDYVIYRTTTDGGYSWETRFVDTSKMYPDHRPKPIYSIAYLKKDLILCGSDSGYILKSTDGGFTWNKRMMTRDTSEFADSTNLNLYRGKIIKLKIYNNIGYAFTNNGKLYITEDWGDSWKKINIVVSEGNINRIDSFSSPDTNAIFISFLSITNEKDSLVNYYSSFNRGKTWDKIQTVKGWHDTSSPRSIEYITRSDGWGTTSVNVSNDYNNFKPFLFNTKNGGKSWHIILTDSAFGLSTYSVPSFSDSSHLAVYHNGVIYLTSNGGASWFINKIEYDNHPEFSGSGNIVYYSEDKLITAFGPFIIKYKGNVNNMKDEYRTNENIINYFIENDIVRIYIQDEIFNSLQIYSILGEKMFEYTEIDNNCSKNKNFIEINVSFLSSGAYLLRFGNRVQKILKL